MNSDEAMIPIKKNIFEVPVSDSNSQEVFDDLLKTDNFFVERIFTKKAFTNPGKWYDQERDEWVLLLQGEAILEFKKAQVLHLKAGDYIFIPAHQMHRISHSSVEPKCIWLAIHGKLK